jgi:hypothetical protein
MESPLAILETAISDVGYWRWWNSNLPDAIQLEFGGTQLCFPPMSPDQVTSGLLAIRLRKPLVALFLAGNSAGLPDDWPEAMARDEYDPFTLEYGRITLTSLDKAVKFVSDAGSIRPLVGTQSDLANHRDKAILAFWAGRAGFVGVAESIALFNMQGEVDVAAIPDWHSKWWSYWKDYWARKDTPNPMPKDYTCEVTIPVAGG